MNPLSPSLPTPRRRRLPVLALALALLPALSPLAAQVPADSLLRDFEPSGDFQLMIADKVDPEAKIYHSQRAGAVLVRSPQLDTPLLISPREGSVQSVSFMSLMVRADGAIDLLADADLKPQGQFVVDDAGIHFTYAGKKLLLGEKPPLLGLHQGTELAEYNPAYQRGAAEYEPDMSVVESLRGQGEAVRVRVFFGSWCSFCKRYVPRMLKVAEELAGSKVQVEYYGLPHGFTSEPEAQKFEVKSVPTAIVYLGDRIIGRIEGNQWSRPEHAIYSLLNGL